MKYKGVKLSLILIVFAFMLFFVSGCNVWNRYEWEQVYNAYTQENDKFEYQNVNATITKDNLVNIKTGFKAEIDFEDYLERYKDNPTAKTNVSEYQSQGFYFVTDSIVLLEKAGFFDDINEETVLTLTINNYIGWDGWYYPIFGVAINGKSYLDFETGYENVLNFVREKIDNLS